MYQLTLEKQQDLQNFFNSDIIKKKIQTSFPKNTDLTPEIMIRHLFNLIQENPELAFCTKESLLNAVIKASVLGLEISTPLGFAYIVPYKNKNGELIASLIVGYKGYITLAHRAKAYPVARIVYQGDFFQYEYGTEEYIKHIPCGESDPEKITHAYAIIHVSSNIKIFNVVSMDEIKRIKARSPASNSSHSPWNTDFPAMCQKVAIKQTIKYTPIATSPQIAIALYEDDIEVENKIKDVTPTITDEKLIISPQPIEISDLEEKKNTKKRGRPKKEEIIENNKNNKNINEKENISIEKENNKDVDTSETTISEPHKRLLDLYKLIPKEIDAIRKNLGLEEKVIFELTEEEILQIEQHLAEQYSK